MDVGHSSVLAFVALNLERMNGVSVDWSSGFMMDHRLGCYHHRLLIHNWLRVECVDTSVVRLLLVDWLLHHRLAHTWLLHLLLLHHWLLLHWLLRHVLLTFHKRLSLGKRFVALSLVHI